MKKSFVKKYLKNKYVIIVVIILIAVSCLLFFRGGSAVKIDYVAATMSNVTEQVSVTGKISPVEKADLAFEKSGLVTVINVKVGDNVKKGDIMAALDSAGDKAALASAQAKLSDLGRGLNAPEFALEQSKINSARTSLSNAKQDALNAARTAFVQTQGAVNNYADIFFNNPQTANPTINIRTQSNSIQNSINQERASVSDVLANWKKDIDNATSTDSAASIISKATACEVTVKSFMGDLSSIINDLDAGNSGLSRPIIDSRVLSMNSGLSALNQAISSITAAKTSLENVSSNYDQTYSNFLLKNSGSSVQSIAAQSAVVDSYKAELAKDQIVAPIDGVVTKVEPNLGEFISPGSVAFGIISGSAYKIEAYVPEADIAKIAIGNIASTTLDAYGQYVDFPSTVVSIDPAETILEGVPTYKVTLNFLQADQRIRSGMTANLDILTRQKNGVVAVPARAIVDDNGTKSVRIMNADGKTFRSVPVMVGLKGSNGLIEILKGVGVGEKAVTYVK